MEFIVSDNKVFIIGKMTEVIKFLKDRSTTCKTLKDLIITESQLYQKNNTYSLKLSFNEYGVYR